MYLFTLFMLLALCDVCVCFLNDAKNDDMRIVIARRSSNKNINKYYYFYMVFASLSALNVHCETFSTLLSIILTKHSCNLNVCVDRSVIKIHLREMILFNLLQPYTILRTSYTGTICRTPIHFH